METNRRSTLLKVFLLMLTTIGFVAGLTNTVKANGGSVTVTGRWAGSAFANPAFDLNGDGAPARTLDVKAYDNLPFAGLEGIADAGVVSFGVCAPGAFELKAFGKFTFRGRTGDGLYAEVDPAAPNLCFDPAHPSEVLTIRFVGGTGAYEHATGTGTLTLHDHTRFPDDPAAFPLMVDTRGEFVLHVSL